MCISRLGACSLLAALSLIGLASGAHAQQTFSYTFTGTEPSGPNRMFRDGNASQPGVQKTFAGTSTNGQTYFFRVQPVTVNVGETVMVVQNTGGLGVFLGLYRDTFSPTSLITNYAADAGSSRDSQAFFFTNPGGSNTFQVVMMNVTGTNAAGVQGVSGSFTVATPEPGSLALLALGGVGGFALLRRRRSGK
jgi:hypothetical protein